MTKTKFPRSVAKFIRRRKAEIRRKVEDVEERERLIKELLSSLTPTK